MLRGTWSPGEAARVLSEDVVRLNELERHGTVRASIPASGRGSKGARRYTFRDLVRLRAACELRAQGVERSTVAKVAARLAGRRPPLDLADVRLAVAAGRVVEVKPGTLIEDVLTGQSAFAFVLDLSKLAREVKAAATLERDAAGRREREAAAM